MNDYMKYLGLSNRILLGLVMLIPGLLKLFVMGPDKIVGMLDGLGFPAAALFAWVLIVVEIVTGVLILGNWFTRYAVFPAIVILVVAAFTAHWGNWPNVLVHLALSSNYLLMGFHE